MKDKVDERIQKLFDLTEAGKTGEFEAMRQQMICEFIHGISDPEKRRKAILT